ncbi:MAG: hypothetical protein ABI690_14635 [Chloroflexota bacterium]
MHKSLFRWRLGATVLIICLMLAFNTVVILAQDATDEPPAASTEPTETETPLPIPTDTPTVSPTVEEPTLAPTETPVATEETVTPEATETEVATEEVTAVPPTDATAETPTVVAPVTEEPALSLLVRELFDNGDLTPWLAGAGWSLEASESGQALQVVNSNDPIVLQKGAFYNVAVQTRFLWATGSAQISVRRTAVGNYTASIDANGSVTLKRGDDVAASASVAPAAAGTWRTLRLSAMNDVIRVSIDDVAVITYSDIAPLPPGDVSLSADFNPAPGDVNPTPEMQTLLADDFFLWVPLAELGLYPVPTPITAPTQPPATEVVPTEVPTEIVVIETTPEPTEVVVEPTEEVTAEPTETEVAPVEQSGPQDDLTEAVGKDQSEVAPPSAEELANAQDASNDNFAGRLSVILPTGFYVFSDGTVNATLEGSEPVPVCGTGLNKTVWFTFTTPASPATASYTFSTAGSSFDTILGVYTGGSIGSLSPVGCNDDASASLITSQLTLTLTASTTYQIQVGGFKGRYGAYTFRVQQGAVPTTLAAPVIVAPSPATGITSNQPAPTFTWNKIAINANSYEVQVATNAAFTTGFQSAIVNSASCTTTCSYTVSPALSTPATYYWRVRGRTLNDLPGAFSPARTFIYRTAAPTLSLPADNAVSTTSKPALKWIAYLGASYKIQIADNVGFAGATTYTPAGVGVTFTPPTSLIQGDWWWRVAATPALNSGDTPYSTPRKFTVNISSLPANNALAPLVGTAINANVKFTWITVFGATGYTVVIDNDSDFSSPLAPVTPTPATALTVTTPLPAGVYYWYVKPTGFVPNVTNDTDVIRRKFTVSPPAPAAPVLVAPLTAAFTNDTTPTLDWNPTTTIAGDPFSYDVQVCAAATCATTIYDSANVTVGTEYDVATPLNPGLNYWRVRTVNSLGIASAYSAARTFTVRTNILSAPVDNFTTIDTTPGFTWLSVTYPNTAPPVKYKLQVAADTSFTTIQFEKTDLTVLTYMMAGADPTLGYGTHYWRVLVNTGSGYPGSSSEYRTLHITSSIPVAPTYPAVPAASAVLADTTPHLDVNDVVPPVTASWTVTGYEFQVATNSAFTLNMLPFSSPTSDFTSSALTPGLYYFRGRAINSNGAAGTYSAARAFTIRTAPPVQSAPALELVTTDTTPLFSWVTFGTGSKYNIEIDNNSDCNSPFVTNPALLTTTTFTSPVLTEGAWYWDVQAVDVQGTATAFSGCRVFYVRTTPALAAPVVVSPATGFATNPQPTLVWNAVPTPAGVGALPVQHYQVQIATNATFTVNLQTSPDVPVNSPTVQYTTSGLLAGTYYWRVRGFNTAGIPGAFSVVRNFIIDATGTLVPSLTLPADNSSSTVKTPTFTWTKPVGAVKFELRYSSNYPASYVPGDALTTTGTVAITGLLTPTYKPPSPLIPGTYYWQVRALDAANNLSAWTNLRTFKIISALTDTPQPNRFGPSDTILLTWGPLSWVTNTAAPDGGYYEVQIDNNFSAANALFPSPEYELRGSGDTVGTGVTYSVYVAGNNYGVVIPSGSLPAGLPNGTWYWHVRGYNPTTNAYGAWSSTGTFVVDK